MSRCFGDAEELFDIDEHKPPREINEGQWFAEFKDPKQYVETKVKMLIHDMCIIPTKEEIEHLMNLRTATTIDNAVRSIISRHWG